MARNYWVLSIAAFSGLDAALFYAVNDAVDLPLNVENLTGEEYWYAAHNDNNTTLGASQVRAWG